MKTKLNIHLLSTLPRVLRMTHNEVSDASGISIACWYRLVKNPQKITVQQLLDLANGLNIPVSRFFSSAKANVVGVREDYILPPHDYLRCYYDSDAVYQHIGKGTATSWRDAASAVGMHWTNVSASLLAVSRTPVTRLLDLCEAFNFNLFEFLVDPNMKHGDIRPDKTANPYLTDLRKQIDTLNKKISVLTERYDALLKRHNELEKSFHEYFGSRMGMAAGPTTVA